MDLVALLNEDGQLNVHRTLSWDRILAKSIEIGDDAWGMPTSVSFSPSGNLLALGHARGQISVVNMESGDVMKAYDSGHLHSNVANIMSYLQVIAQYLHLCFSKSQRRQRSQLAPAAAPKSASF